MPGTRPGRAALLERRLVKRTADLGAGVWEPVSGFEPLACRLQVG